jgi:predicted Zn-dependent protease
MQPPENDIALMMETGHLCRYARRFQEAREIFHGVALLLPSREPADLALAAVACDEGKFEEAANLCRRVLLSNQRSAMAYAQLAEVELAKGNIVGAMQNLKLAKTLRPAESHMALIRSLEQFAALRKA